MDGYMDSQIPLPGDKKGSSYVAQVAMMTLNLPDQDEFLLAYDDLKPQHDRRDSRVSMGSEANSSKMGSAEDDQQTNGGHDSTSETKSIVIGSKRKMRKNNREKRRRLELNDKFEVLTDMLNMSGSKAEKFVILSEAIRLIESLRIENNSMQHEKAKLISELQQMSSALHQRFPGTALPEYQGTFPLNSESSTSFTDQASDHLGFGAPGLDLSRSFSSLENAANSALCSPFNLQSLSNMIPGSTNIGGGSSSALGAIPTGSFNTSNSSPASESNFDIFV